MTPQLVFELPAVASIRDLSATAALPAGTSAQLQIAAATQPTAFHDVGTIALNAGSGSSAVATLDQPFTARWVRLRILRSGSGTISLQSLEATGDMTVPAGTFSGRWAGGDVNGADTVFEKARGSIPPGTATTGAYVLAADVRNDALVVATCWRTVADVWRGSIADGRARIGTDGSLYVVGNGSLLAGYVSPSYVLARRVANARDCDVAPSGRGPGVVVVARYPSDAARLVANVPGYRYKTVLLPLVRQSDLTGARVAVLAMSCAVADDTDAAQQRTLLTFVAAGHVLVVRDADACTKSAYAFIPYPFTTAASGAGAARGSVLSIADSSLLASSDSSDRDHSVDTAAYLKNYLQQLGDADVMQTSDQHWCGLMFAKNAKGSSGWVRAYARYGKGLIVYDGFDADDLGARIPQAVRLTRLAYDVPPGADLPCNAHVASQLQLFSSVHRNAAYGSSRDERFAFVVDREGAGFEPIRLSVAGERASGWRASVDPSEVDLGPGNQRRVSVVVHVPANATPTRHLFVLTATGDRNDNAQASIELDVNEALAKQLERGGRARIYGIHFDVNSARIQARSETAIAQIALVLRAHPAWRMRVEGYTDSDGGAAYNLTLSRRRAAAVVRELATGYHIASNRLRSAGYGPSHPVAPNTSDAGKALNRRVELVRL